MDPPPPAILFHGCPVLTMNPERSIADAIAIQGDRIIAIGPVDEVKRAVAGKATTIIDRDVQGRCIVPGFIDTHMHPGFAIYFKAQVNLAGSKSLAEIIARMQPAVATAAPGAWTMGVDLMEDMFDDPTSRHFPTRENLDRVSLDRPVIVMRHDGHILSVNSTALAIIGITRENKDDMLGDRLGEVRLDEHGGPNGIFTENATAIVLDHVSLPTMDQFITGGREFSMELASHGITAIGGIIQLGEEGIAGKAGAAEWPLLEMLLRDEVIDQDIAFYFVTRKPRQVARVARALAKSCPDETRFKVAGVKAYADGSYGARTAAMFEPFSDSSCGQAGFLIIDPGELEQIVAAAHELGYQVATHAIGDKANDVVVDIYARVMAASPGGPAHRVEHASSLTPAIIEKAAASGIIFACQPAFITSEHTWLPHRLGPGRVAMAYPFKSILDGGIVLAGASDAPVESPRVMDAIHACVTRHGMVPSESITVMDALAMFTINAARALGWSAVKGSLEPGKHADMAILSADPRAVDPDAIPALSVVETIHRGKTVFTMTREEAPSFRAGRNPAPKG